MERAQRKITRRSFAAGTLAGTLAGGFLHVLGKPRLQAAEEKQPLFDISLAQWSFHRTFRGQNGETERDPREFAAMARELEIGAVEYVNQFFMDKAKDSAYLAELKRRADDAGVKSLLIMCDREGNLGDSDDAKRKQAVENHYKWVEAARELGCHSIRVNAASNPQLSFDEQMNLAADGLRRLCEFADSYQINVIVENHGGLSSHGSWLAGVMKKVDHPRCGTLPDFGNFAINRERGEWYDRYKGMAELMPFAKGVSAKSHDFDADGNEVYTDYLRVMRIVLDAGYRGYVGIEYEGPGKPERMDKPERTAARPLNERDGVIATRDLLRRVRDQLSA